MENNYREFKGNSLLDLKDDYVLVDIETTGFSPKFNDIIEIGAIKVQSNKIIDRFQSLISIPYDLDPFITNLTGITNEMLKNEGHDIKSVLSDFANFIGNDVLIAHNANFDINFLYDKCLIYNDYYLRNDFIDTMRLSKRLCPNLPNHKLATLAQYFNVDYSNAHRGLNDVLITFDVYNKLKHLSKHYYEIKLEEIQKNLIPCKDFYNKKVIVKTVLKYLNFQLIKTILQPLNTETYDAFYTSCDYLIVNDATYEKYVSGNSQYTYYAEKYNKIISESMFCELFNIPYHRTVNQKNERISSKDIVPETNCFDETHPLYQKKCVFTGTLQKMNRKQAMQFVVNLGGLCQDNVTNTTNYLILGNNNYCKSIKDGKSSKQKKAETLKLKGNDIEIIPEDVFYDIIN